MNINTKALKGVIEEVEASKLRQKAEADLQREAIKRAVKEHQLDGKALRLVLQRRAMGESKRDEQDYYVHAYELALGEKKHAADALAAGAGVRETARATGLSVGTVSAMKKGVQKSSELNTDHDADGVIIEDAAPQGDSTPLAPQTAEAFAAPAVTPSLGGEGTGTHPRISQDDAERSTESCGSPEEGRLEVHAPRSGSLLHPGPHDTSLADRLMGVFPKADEASTTPSVGAVASPEGERVARAELVARTPIPDDDPLEIPPFLRGSARNMGRV